ncbi:two-component system sensor histidine kinase NtrB [Paenibacillus flagellatus]|uniref:histidine kinase n=1 Tax=Paenibacillus flagellatus TaxID=2211139 RepID=A0A2V5KSA7_9BACL|nr:ATP-binding protein [Paenibacillus flagellatus]PYI54477.1 histidine kinase [Paenibacillus flagellatus]
MLYVLLAAGCAGIVLLGSVKYRAFISGGWSRQSGSDKRPAETRDPLTGLIGRDEFVRRIDGLNRSASRVLMVLIDCYEIKSLSEAEGVEGIDRMLKQVAEMLYESIPDATLVARYGGNEFAMAFRGGRTDDEIGEIRRMLDYDIPKRSGVRLAYGFSASPDDGKGWAKLLHAAETRLNAMKRELWEQRENHMARSEKLRVVGELASGMAHEIRNPLTTIKGFLQLSRANGYNIEPWYALIMNEVDRMSELTTEFLRFSKPRDALYETMPLHVCIQRVVSLTESETSRLGHRLVYETSNPGIAVRGDQDKLIQVLLNLVKNALEAMPGQGLVTIRLMEQASRAVIEVSDTGVGIPREELDRIFQPFYTSKEQGTGLGLSICQKIVHDHGGMIEVESEPGAGTTFRITLPLHREGKDAGE